MKNIITIIKEDLRHITGNVVGIIVVIGLCLVPCLYAWFNIFSNWEPYNEESTSRLQIAVVSEDKGLDLLGININAGDKIIQQLQANSSLGWQFMDSADTALESVYSGQCYAALVIPEDFSDNILSFIEGEIKSPEIAYYENDKKNAIAPRITAQAKTALENRINASFVQTIVEYATDVISVIKNSGFDAEALLVDLSDDAAMLSSRLYDCCVALDSVADLTTASLDPISVSCGLLGNTGSSLKLSREILENTAGDIGSTGQQIQNTADAVSGAMEQTITNLRAIYDDTESIGSDLALYNSFVENSAKHNSTLLKTMEANCSSMSADLAAIGLTGMSEKMGRLGTKLGRLYDIMQTIADANDNIGDIAEETIDSLNEELLSCMELARNIRDNISPELTAYTNELLDNIQSTSDNVSSLLSSFGESTGIAGAMLDSYTDDIDILHGGFAKTKAALLSAQQEMASLSRVMANLANSPLIKGIGDTLDSNSQLIGDYLAAPVRMETIKKYDAGNFGSAMAPFYTILAQWVGALLYCTMLRIRERNRSRFDLPQHYLGKYGLFFLIGMTQSMLVALGDIFYVQIQCAEPLRFIFGVLLIGFCFSMINYALTYLLGHVGVGLSVVIMLIQVAGAGGTMPVEILPEIFQKLYDFMPFKYAMNALREAVGGSYGTAYGENLLILLAVSFAVFIIGIVLSPPCNKLKDMIDNSRSKCEVMLFDK